MLYIILRRACEQALLGLAVYINKRNKLTKFGAKTCQQRRADRGSKPPTSRMLHFRLPRLFSWLPPLSPFLASKYYASLLNIPLFLPLPILLELPPTALSSPAFHTPSAVYSPGLQPPVFPHKEAERRGEKKSAISEFVKLLLLKKA